MGNETLNMPPAKILDQRCFFLFLALLALLVALPFLSETTHGPVILFLINVTILLTAVAATGRSRSMVVIAVILVLPAIVFRFLALESGQPGYLVLTWGFNAVFYVFILARLLHYVLRRDFMTSDKLYGAVAAYILVAIFWAQLHGVTQYFYPGAYAFGGTPKALDMAELIYFSFVALTTAGFGDVTPALVQSRFLTILEMIAGVMFVAILIARLTGVYPVVDKPIADKQS
ncbi:MAG: voltage-gated potassium channel [Nitrospirae bacterium]|nr:voltage-gated potassium channel [Nitrospirota bacterium]